MEGREGRRQGQRSSRKQVIQSTKTVYEVMNTKNAVISNRQDIDKGLEVNPEYAAACKQSQ